MLMILCIISGFATAALTSWLQPALEGWAVTQPDPDEPRPQRFCRAQPGLARAEQSLAEHA
jgi:hypothetical protein